MKDLDRTCPCGHPAYLHRSKEQTATNVAAGKHYVGECTGHRGGGDTGACCQCQVDRDRVMGHALDERPGLITPGGNQVCICGESLGPGYTLARHITSATDTSA